jgi:hypothetical protein
MLTLFAHVIAREDWSTAGDNPHRIATRVSVDTEEGFRRHNFLLIFSIRR